MTKYDLKPIIKTFYDALEEGTILGRKCQRCGHVEFPPFLCCNDCGCLDTEWVDLTNMRGVVKQALPTRGAFGDPEFRQTHGDYFAIEVHVPGVDPFSTSLLHVDYDKYAEFDKVIECSGSQSGLDLAVSHCGMAGDIYLFGWHRTPRTIDFKTEHLRGHRLIHTSPAIDSEKEYSRYWPKTIKLFEAGVFDLRPLISHKYAAEDIAQAMVDSVKREEGFVKSVFYLEPWKGTEK